MISLQFVLFEPSQANRYSPVNTNAENELYLFIKYANQVPRLTNQNIYREFRKRM